MHPKLRPKAQSKKSVLLVDDNAISHEHCEKPYQTAITETDWSKMEGLIEAADSALGARFHQFSVTTAAPRIMMD
jgi:hypothetical protein